MNTGTLQTARIVEEDFIIPDITGGVRFVAENTASGMIGLKKQLYGTMAAMNVADFIILKK